MTIVKNRFDFTDVKCVKRCSRVKKLRNVSNNDVALESVVCRAACLHQI
jgi:hypothetical protein